MDSRIKYCITQIENQILHSSTDHSAQDALIQSIAKDIKLSRFHLTRLFTKDLQYSPRDYIHRNLMGRCALMVAHTRQSPFSIAIDMGFSNQQAFTRAFTRYWGISPAKFRQAHSRYVATLNAHAGQLMEAAPLLDSQRRVFLRETSPVRFWAIRYEGMWYQRQVCWNDFRKLFARYRGDMLTGPFFGLTYDSPLFVPSAFVRYYCGVQVPPGFGPKPDDVFEISLPSGRVAACEALCKSEDVPALYSYMLDKWLPQSGYSLRASCFVERFGELPENWGSIGRKLQLNCWIQ